MTDAVPNVRFNLAKSLNLIGQSKKLRENLLWNIIKPSLEQLYCDNDLDVKYHSYLALNDLNLTE